MRTLWRNMLDGDLLHRAYSLDTVAEELLYVTGPLLAGACAAFALPALGVAVSAVLVLTGALLLLASPAVPSAQQRTDVRREPAEPERWRRGLTAVRSQPAVVGPVLVSAGVGMCLGAVNLLVVAFAGRHHHVAAVAWVEAALSLGSVLGGLVYGAATWRAAPPVRLSLLAGALGVAVAAAGFSANIVVLAILMAVAGLFVSPALATAYLAADEGAPPHARTQAGAWVNTGFNVGDSGGAAGLGLLVATVPLALCFVVAAAPAVLAAAVPLARGSRNATASPLNRTAIVATERS
jgi:predicted MFS family arabinose efflux permease